MEKQCWQCDRSFDKNEHLKVHMASHGCLEVTCPWCLGTRKVLRRTVDLVAHVKDNHKDIFVLHKTKKLLTEITCFILAVNPGDYRRTIGSIPSDCKLTDLLKDAVGKWSSDESQLIEIKKGWTEYGGLNTPMWELELDYDQSEVQIGSPPYSIISPIVETEYSPSRPDMEVLAAITIGSDEVYAVVYVPTEDSSFSSFRKLVIDPTISKTAKTREALIRRMGTIQTSDDLPKLPTSWERLDNVDVNIQRVCQKIGVSPESIQYAMKEYISKRKVTLEEYKEKPTKQAKYQFVMPTSPTHGLPLVVKRSSKERALAFLTSGSMHLLTSARRKWNKVGVLDLPLPGIFKSWPPISWKSMTSDGKLLMWETAATQLGLLCGMEIDRELLLDTFSFLALPGTKERKIQKPMSLTRYNNFRLVRKVAKGEVQSADSDDIITQLEMTLKVTNTHPVVALH